MTLKAYLAMSSDVNTEETRPPIAAYRRLIVGLVLVVGGLLWIRGHQLQEAETAESNPAQPIGAVRVVFQQPDAEPTEAEVPLAQGDTVFEATSRAATTRWQGKGAMALLQSINGIGNQGADGLNWQFEVNGQYADRGAGDYPLKPGDRILWKLAPYE